MNENLSVSHRKLFILWLSLKRGTRIGRIGEWENRGMGESGNGRIGEWENRGMGESGNGNGERGTVNL